MPPETLGRYEILDELGKGAMGIVYLARDPLIGRQLALKTFRLGYSAGDKELEQFRARFLREAQSAGILTHPNIVTIHDVVTDEGGSDFFIAMEYVQGTDLKLLMQRQRLEPKTAVDLISQVAEGLGYAHSKGVVHRDIKPANIIITAEKQAKITDFGIARVETSNLTTEGQLLGTPNYMAPEQIQGKEVDHRADLFSLGVMLYETLTGQKPFAAESLTAVTHRIVFEPFTPLAEAAPGLPDGLQAILERAMAKDPAARYDSGQQMAEDLQAVFGAPPTTATQTQRTASFLAPEGAAPAAPLEATPAVGVPTAAGTPTAGTPTAGAPTAGAPAVGTPAAGTPAAGDPAAEGTLLNASMAAPVNPTPTAGIPVPQAAPSPSVPAATGATAVPTATTAVATPAASKSSGLPMAGRIALGVAALLVLAGLAFVGSKILTPEEAPQREAPELGRQADVEPLVARGRELLEAGDAAGALAVLQRAATLAPADREIVALRDQAQGLLESPDGETVASSGSSPVATPPAPPERRRAPPPPAAKVTLAVDFFSEVSEGRLTIFDGQDMLLQQQFSFVSGRSGVLRRARKVSGSLKGNINVTSGDVDLRIYVKPTGEQTRSHELKARIEPGGGGTLRIQVSPEGRITAQLE